MQKHRKFTVTFYEGFKKTGATSMICGSQEGMTLKEAEEYCKDKFPGRRIKVKA